MLILAVVSRAGAAAIFDNEGDFLAAVGSPLLESFEALANTDRNTDPIVTPSFTMTIAPIGPGALNWRVTDESRPTAGVFPTDGVGFVEAGGGIAGNGAAFSISFAFAGPITGIAMEIVDFGDHAGTGVLGVELGTGGAFDIASVPPTLANGNLIFVGLSDPTLPFSTLTLTKTTTTDGIGIDQIYIVSASTGGSSIPEPATLAIFGFGLAGLIWMRRRRAA